MNNDEIENIKQLIRNYERALPRLKVLIFGPSEQNPDGYARKCFEKRLSIKKSLSEKNHIAILPEEAFNEAQRQGKDIQNITAFEKHLIENECDIAIFLLVPKCPGVDHELSVFTTMPECVRKILLFYANDCKYESDWLLDDKIDFIKGGSGRVESFCHDDIIQCHVQKKAIQEVESISRFLSIHPYRKYQGVK